jgi:hypothetical protein
MPATIGRHAVISGRDTTSGSYKTGPIAPGSLVFVDTRFDTKIAVLLRDDLQPWQELNVCAFLVSGIAAADPALLGEPYLDADDTRYLPMFRQPVLVFQGDKQTLTSAHSRALGRGIACAVFTADLFATGNDEDNRAAVRAVPTSGLDLVGIALHSARNAVDKVLKGARMHP